jgi:DNA-binding response OmpR family regulator
MTEYEFTNVEAVVVDSQLHAVRLLREMLVRLGIKKTEVFDNADTALTHLGAVNADLVLVDCDGPLEADAFRFVRSLRNDMTAQNPYAGIIVTCWQPTQAHVVKMTNAGADALLMKPFSPRQLLDRMGALIEARKKFVVTSDFVGPDRRKHPREGAQVPLFDVPNTLRFKALNRPEQGMAKQLIADANTVINGQKCLRGGIQVGFLVEYAAVSGLAARSRPDRWALDHVGRVPSVLDDLEKRLKADQRMPALSHCATVRRHALAIRDAAALGPVSAEEVAALQGAVHDLMRVIDPARPIEAIVHEVKTAVAAYAVRLEAMSQAKIAARAE